MESIQIKGMESFDDVEKKIVNELVSKHIAKIKRMLNNDFFLRITVRAHSKDSENKIKRKRYVIDFELTGEIPKICASSEEWDLNKSIHSGFQKLEHEIEHKFHISEK